MNNAARGINVSGAVYELYAGDKPNSANAECSTYAQRQMRKYTQKHTTTHTCMSVNTCRFIQWLSHTGTHFDTEHLTIPEWLHHKMDTTKSCSVTSQHRCARSVLCYFVSDRRCRQEQTGNNPNRHKYT